MNVRVLSWARQCTHTCVYSRASSPKLNYLFRVRIGMNGPTTERQREKERERNSRRQWWLSGANVETSDDRMQIASLTRRMQVHNTDVYTPLGVGVYTCVNGPMTGAVVVSRSLVLSPLLPLVSFLSSFWPPSLLALETSSLLSLSLSLFPLHHRRFCLRFSPRFFSSSPVPRSLEGSKPAVETFSLVRDIHGVLQLYYSGV